MVVVVNVWLSWLSKSSHVISSQSSSVRPILIIIRALLFSRSTAQWLVMLKYSFQYWCAFFVKSDISSFWSSIYSTLNVVIYPSWRMCGGGCAARDVDSIHARGWFGRQPSASKPSLRDQCLPEQSVWQLGAAGASPWFLPSRVGWWCVLPGWLALQLIQALFQCQCLYSCFYWIIVTLLVS